MGTPGWVLGEEIGYSVLTFLQDGRKWACISIEAVMESKPCLVAWSWMICNFSKVGDVVTLDQDNQNYVVTSKFLGASLRVGEGPKPQVLVLERVT